jgi:hypothetical protein
MRTINKDAKSIKEDGYSFVINQCVKVGTHVFSLGTHAENYKIFEQVITDEMKVDEYGYPCIVLQDVTTNMKKLERIELLACSLHTHNNNDFLSMAEAERERQLRFKEQSNCK